MIPIDKKILGEISKKIDKYNLSNKEDKIALSFSGGKDSIFYAQALKQLGFTYEMILLDIGFEKNWKEYYHYLYDKGFQIKY